MIDRKKYFYKNIEFIFRAIPDENKSFVNNFIEQPSWWFGSPVVPKECAWINVR